jgi:exopolysaccharide biosynthesis predicted pyruvyltransferase EpsI/glycosyltransferase involved in cell wall biosynthesis
MSKVGALYGKPSREPKSRRQKICLAMIVKDEAPVIARCLASVRPLIHYWIIVDTGSTDDTLEVVSKAMHDMPGELHQRPWVDFAHNRSEALRLARVHGDYTLIIDADDVLELPRGFKMPFLRADSYTVEICHQERRYWRPQLISNARPWRYEGVLHEFLSFAEGTTHTRVLPEERSQGRLPGVGIRMSEEGARRRRAANERYSRDAEILERASASEADPFLLARYIFYLAHSYFDAGEKEKALESFQRRATLGFWRQEIFISLYRSAALKAELGFDHDDVIATYLSAHEICRDRAEALHGAARFCRNKQRYQQGYDLAKRATTISYPKDGLFLEEWIYQYAVVDEFAVNAYWIGRYDDCLAACERLLREQKFPSEMRERIEQNAHLARDKLSSQLAEMNGRAEAISLPVTQARTSSDGAAPQPTTVPPRLDEERHEPGPGVSSEKHIDDLARTLERLIGGRPVALLDWPLYANAGDHLIWLGEKVILKHRLHCKLLFECSLKHIDLLAMTRLPPETVLVMQGGGNFGDLYAHHQRLREAIVAAFPDRRIVIMPQTVMFQSDERLAQSSQSMTLHPDLHVMARDQDSFTTLKTRMRLSNCYLHTDSSLALQPVVAKLAEVMDTRPEREVVHLLRRDAETSGISAIDGVAHDWISWDDLAEYADTPPPIHAIDIARDAFDGEFDNISWRRLCAAIRLFGTAHRIVTDRLHGHILALMMGKRHQLHDNSYGKNGAFCRAWTRNSPLLQLSERPGPAVQHRPGNSLEAALYPPDRPADTERRLGLIIPYRNREDHLAKLIPHLISYFARVRHPGIHEVRILVVEQQDNLPFNRGSLLNAGFIALENLVDYVCFHDVDYLPMWADYSYTEMPTRIIWWGMHSRPIRVTNSSVRTEAPRAGLGAVALISNDQFRLVNGYSNRYFGWGFEDKDLAARCRLHSLTIMQKDGTFIPLDHDNAGFLDDGSKAPIWLENQRRFAENAEIYGRRGTAEDGLSNFAGRVGAIGKVEYAGLDNSEKFAVMRVSVTMG